MTKTGDTYFTNDGIDNVLVSNDGFWGAAAKLYANGRDLKDPQLSPVYGDMHGFPPTILTSGTRDLFLSNTVRVHRASASSSSASIALTMASHVFSPAFTTPCRIRSVLSSESAARTAATYSSGLRAIRTISA